MVLVSICTAILGLIICASVGAYAIFVLTKANLLFTTSYQEAMGQFNNAGLAVLFAQEDFIQTIQVTLAERAWIKMVGRSVYHKFEEHLDYCACHYPALHRLASGNSDLGIWQLRREESLYKSRKWFMQENWVYWVCGCLVFFSALHGGVWLIVVMIYLIYGGRYIASRGVLVALCDFLLAEGVKEEVPVARNRTTVIRGLRD